MFENLTEKLDAVFRKLKGRGILDEETIAAALKDIRIALLEADVNFRVVKEFIGEVRAEALGQDVLDSISPGHQVVKIVNDRLISLMDTGKQELDLSRSRPAIVMLVGLQGSGKTTTAAKLARMLQNDKRRVLMASVDVYRPAADEQLRILAEKVEAAFYERGQGDTPVDIARKAAESAKKEAFDTLIIDTAGRLHIDEPLMKELEAIQKAVHPCETLLVVDAMTGQDAVAVAEHFKQHIDIGGVILTKMDGDARGGAALSLSKVTGTPIKLVGVGEKISDIEVFHPERMASRILGMGDIVSLVEKAQHAFDEREAQKLEESIRKDTFTLEDLKMQFRQIRKIGSLQNILEMVPGVSKIKALKNVSVNDSDLVKIEAIIDSMTKEERRNDKIINGQRRLRIARGSGTTVQDVNRVLKQYTVMKKMMKKMKSGGLKSLKRGNFPF